jgi:DNA polymerase III delta prime subunit
MSESFLWVEKYRPKKISECILPERLKNVFQEYVNKQEIPNLMLSGTAGVGKTSVAKAMCDEIGINHMYINASENRGIDMMRTTIRNYASTVSLVGGKKVIILDESDYLTADAQAAMRGAIEEFSSNCTFIFTCNYKAKLIDAIHSRCSVIDFSLKNDEKKEMASQFFKRLQHILAEEKIDYDRAVLAKIVEKFFPDYRRTLNELQRYSSSGSIDAGIVAQLSDVRKVGELVKHLKEKNFGEMRRWVVVNSDIDPNHIYRKVYDSLSDHFTKDSIPQAIIIISKYQYQAAFVADQEINLVACLTELMVECSYV